MLTSHKTTGGVKPFVRKPKICYQVIIEDKDLEKIEWLRARYKPKSTIQETVLWLIRRVFERNKAKGGDKDKWRRRSS